MIKCPDTDEAFEKVLVLIHVLRPDFFFYKQNRYYKPLEYKIKTHL